MKAEFRNNVAYYATSIAYLKESKVFCASQKTMLQQLGEISFRLFILNIWRVCVSNSYYFGKTFKRTFAIVSSEFFACDGFMLPTYDADEATAAVFCCFL